MKEGSNVEGSASSLRGDNGPDKFGDCLSHCL